MIHEGSALRVLGHPQISMAAGIFIWWKAEIYLRAAEMCMYWCEGKMCFAAIWNALGDGINVFAVGGDAFGDGWVWLSLPESWNVCWLQRCLLIGAIGLYAFQVCVVYVILGTPWNCNVLILNVLQNLPVPGSPPKLQTWNACTSKSGCTVSLCMCGLSSKIF